MLKISESLAKSGWFSRVELIGMSRDSKASRVELGSSTTITELGASHDVSSGAVKKLLRLLRWYAAVLAEIRGRQITSVSAHALSVLPLALMVRILKRAVLVYEPHELETETHQSRGWRRVLAQAAERACIRFADAVCVVNSHIADWYRRTYDLNDIVVVRNVPRRSKVQIPSGQLRAALSLPSEALLFLYQGAIAPGRGIEQLAGAFKGLSDRHLAVVGYGAAAYVEAIKEAAPENVHFLAAVPPEQLPMLTADADVGMCLIENVSLSYYLCLPNKLFEYLAAGVPVIASDFPAMREVVSAAECGWLVEPSAASLRALVTAIDRTAIEARQRNAAVVRHAVSWEEEERELYRLYTRILGPAPERLAH